MTGRQPAKRDVSAARVTGDVAVVRLCGSVDRAGLEAGDWLITQAQARGAVVDLMEAEHIDYEAAPILVARRRVLKARGGELAVAAGRQVVRHILRAAVGIELQIFPTVPEALAFVRGGPGGDGAAVALPVRAKARGR